MNYQAELEAAKGFVLTRWHSFWGGIVIGAVGMWLSRLVV